MRPRSLLGSIAYLASLHARRRPGLAVALCAGALGLAWLVTRGEGTVRPEAAAQAAVLADGFVVIDGTASARRVTELDAAGAPRSVRSLAPLPSESRVVGTASGAAVAWRDGARLALSRLEPDGARRPPQRFGKRVRALCDGVASNDLRFGVGWIEAGGDVWMVFGPTRARATHAIDGNAIAADATDATDATDGDERAADAIEAGTADVGAAAEPTWCTIAVAGEQLIPIWRVPNGVYFNVCGKRCSGLLRRAPAEISRQAVLAVGCARLGCALATRGGDGGVRLTWMTLDGKARWSQPLPDASPDDVAIVGVGDRGVAVGYRTADADGAAVITASADGQLTPRWRGAAAHAPSLAWSQGRLLIGHVRAGALVTEMIPLAP